MASTKHLAVLEQGVHAWNKWRETSDEQPNLSTADLKGKSLKYADLRKADLTGAVLLNADLTRADLSKANLFAANLRCANLYGARLQSANLREVFLFGADLRATTLYRTLFSYTMLTEASLGEAALGQTFFTFTSLKDVKGLETCNHAAPSVLDYYTLLNSGQLPEAFLRGCGVPEEFISYLQSFRSAPLDFYSCFISYSTKDEKFVQRLYADLQNKGIRCWFAPEDLKIGEKFRVTIDEAIRVYDKLLIVLSDQSVQSEWVEKEVETAFEKERHQKRLMLFPIRLDDAVMKAEAGWAADIRRSRHIGDFREWRDHDAYVKSLERLIRDLKSGKPNTESAKGSGV
jgi:hypothetical protein